MPSQERNIQPQGKRKLMQCCQLTEEEDASQLRLNHQLPSESPDWVRGDIPTSCPNCGHTSKSGWGLGCGGIRLLLQNLPVPV